MPAQARSHGQPQPTQGKKIMPNGLSMAVFSGPGLQVPLRTPTRLTYQISRGYRDSTP